MQIDFLQFLNFNFRLTVFFLNERTILKQKSLTFTHILKRFFTSVTFQSSQKSFSFNQFNEKSVKQIEQLKSCDTTLTNVKISKLTSNSTNIEMIKTATYRMLVKQSDIKIFAVIILKIDWLITTVENKSKEVNLHELSHVKILEKIKVKLSFKYHDYLDVFNQAMINQLSLHHFYNHKIELIDEEMLSQNRLYQMFNHKLQKIKKYLINHLNKEFIFFSFASYISLILFIEKKDDSLHFCIDYRKLNALIKRDHYFLSLIDETFTHIQESKYLIQLNIIVMFHKLHMHSDSKDLTIFTYYLLWLIQISCNALWINKWIDVLSTLYERRVV